MINANELRIGNTVGLNYKINDDDPICMVIELTASGAHLLLHSPVKGMAQFVDYAVLNPIPLTPELLEKCGFKENKLGNHFKKVSVRKEGFKNEIHLIDYYEERGVYYLAYYSASYPITIKTLHQLQNLFFNLCGEELSINL